MNNSGDSTHKARAIEPANFRAQATGIGQSTRASRDTGARRVAAVADAMPAAQRAAVPAAEGVPPPRADDAGLPMAAPAQCLDPYADFQAIYQTKVNGR